MVVWPFHLSFIIIYTLYGYQIQPLTPQPGRYCRQRDSAVETHCVFNIQHSQPSQKALQLLYRFLFQEKESPKMRSNDLSPNKIWDSKQSAGRRRSVLSPPPTSVWLCSKLHWTGMVVVEQRCVCLSPDEVAAQTTFNLDTKYSSFFAFFFPFSSCWFFFLHLNNHLHWEKTKKNINRNNKITTIVITIK